MSTYIYDSERQIAGRISDLKARVRRLEFGITTDENGREYTNPTAQRQWFLDQIERMQAELRGRSD